MSIRDYIYKLSYEGNTLKQIKEATRRFPSVSRDYLLTVYRQARYDLKTGRTMEYDYIVNR